MRRTTRCLLPFVLASGALWAQGPPTGKPAARQAVEAPPRVSTVEFDANGYPILVDAPVAANARRSAAPAGETAARATVPAAADIRPTATLQDKVMPGPVATRAQAPAIASGMAPGSPLLDVFQFTQAPGTFRRLGGLQIWWRITIYDPQGGILGYRELTQTLDCGFAERDRLAYNGDERTYGRSGASVFAELQGRPWPTLAEAAGHELALYGLQARLPWCFGDGAAYSVVARDIVERADERLVRIQLERRPPAGLDVVGPEFDPRPRDRFELVYEPGSGRPREFVHRLASSGEARRLLLEEWDEFEGVPFPRARIYVDDNLRPTTRLAITNLQRATVGDRDFRLR
jgi:hypothetical protein